MEDAQRFFCFRGGRDTLFPMVSLLILKHAWNVMLEGDLLPRSRDRMKTTLVCGPFTT
jgi:hypothetical protein